MDFSVRDPNLKEREVIAGPDLVTIPEISMINDAFTDLWQELRRVEF